MILIIIIKRDYFSSEEKKRRRKRMERTWQNFNTKRGENFCVIFESPHTSERTSALSLDCSQNNARKNFFFVSSVLFVGSRYFLVFHQKLFFLFKKAVKKHLEERL